MHAARSISKQLLLAIVFAMTTIPSHALPEDRSQPIRISADTAVRDDRSRETRYEGNVELTQGSLRIKAESIAVSISDDDNQFIVATGSPAVLRQRPSAEEALVTATAGRIEYHHDSDLVQLSEGARVEQDGALIVGERIDYLISAQRIQADGNSAGNNRVEVVIPPQRLENEGNL
jgi:lipopolysaccharide export system protein LptA